MSTASGMLLGAASWLFAAQLFSVEAIGQTAAIVGACTFVASVAILGLDQTVIRFATGNEGSSSEIINAAIAIAGVAAFALAVIVMPGIVLTTLPSTLIASAPLIVFLAATAASISVGAVADGALLASRASHQIAIRAVAVGLARLLAVGLVGLLGLSVPLHVPILGPWLLGSVLIYAYVARPARFPSGIKSGVHRLRRETRYVASTYLATTVDSAGLSLLPVLILNMSDGTAAGLFHVAWLIGSILFVFPTGVARAVFAEYAADGLRGDDWRKVEFRAVSASAFLALVAATVAPSLLTTIAPAYADAQAPLMWLIASLPLIAFSSIEVTRHRISGDVNRVLLASLIQLSLLLFGIAVLLPRLGITGVAISWFSTQLVFALIVSLSPAKLPQRGRA